MSDHQNHKLETQKQWNTRPCGQIGDITYDLDYFIKVEKYRYEVETPFMKKTYPYNDPNNKGKRILEIGYGQGTDHAQWAASGAEMYGVDLTQKHYELASLNLELRGLKSKLFLQDASALPFEDNYFDIIYSFGVLHHTPDIDKCISEAYRVLKPGGKIILSLYYKHALFHWYKKFFIDYILKLGFLTKGYDGVLATVEGGADGIKIKPLVILYDKKMMQEVLSAFKSLTIKIRHLTAPQLPILNKILPSSFYEKYESRWGWYIIGEAEK
jgi:ubiquinone/menaquinone biosynthesis C-methylase UbiE